MPSITKQVWEILDNDVTIKQDLERGIINVSALAEYLRITYGIDGSPDSVISAIRRYKGDVGVQNDFARIQSALSLAVVSTKTGLSLLTLRVTPATAKYVSQIVQHEHFIKHDIFRLVKTRNGVQVVVDRDTVLAVKQAVPQTALDEHREGLVEIAIRLTQDGWSTKGVLSRIANELSSQGINIEMVFSVYPTISIFLDQKDLVRAHEAIMRISGK